MRNEFFLHEQCYMTKVIEHIGEINLKPTDLFQITSKDFENIHLNDY